MSWDQNKQPNVLNRLQVGGQWEPKAPDNSQGGLLIPFARAACANAVR